MICHYIKCKKEFEPVNPYHIYCTKKCSSTARHARYRIKLREKRNA